MDSSLRERFGRLGPVRAADRVASGSPAVMVLQLRCSPEALRRVDAMLALAKRGLTMLRAKRTIEALIEKGRYFVELPQVDDVDALVRDLVQSGVAAAPVRPDADIDVRTLRERLGLTRLQFALRYGLEEEAVRNWEDHSRRPDTTARSYLKVIANQPDLVERAYAPIPSLG